MKKKKELKKGVRLARAKYQEISGKIPIYRKRAYYQLFQNLNYPDLCDGVDFLSKNMKSTFQEIIWGTALPKDYSELGNVKERPFINSNINSVINHCLIGIRKYHFEISLFLSYKEIYETYLLIGEYDKAELQLDKIETEICYSLWTLENRFLLKELSGKASESKELLSSFNELNKSESQTKYLAHFLCLRAEHSLSVTKYFNDLEISIGGIDNTDIGNAFKNYYRFKLTFLNHIDFNNYGEILDLDFSHSIIDRYLNLVKLLTNLLVVSTYLDDENEKRGKIKAYLINRLNYLLRKVNDPILYKLKLFAGDVLFPAFNTNQSDIEIRIIDNYTIGLYNNVESELQELLLKKPFQFDLYILYIKSLIFQKKIFTPIGKSRSIQNEILSDIYKIISVNTNPIQASSNLLRIANNLTSSIVSYGITDFVYFQTHGRRERTLLSRLSYNAANPIIHEIFESEKEKVDYINLLSEKFPNSITIDFFKEKLKGIECIYKFEKKIPEGKYKLEYARTIQSQNDFLGASKVWEYLIENYKDTPPIFETAIINLFSCYYELNELDECINLFVDSYFVNNHIIIKIETNEILKKIKTNRFRNVEKTINLPIFYTIVDADEIETHIAFELFNSKYNKEKPSQWLTDIDTFPYEKIMYFLENTCSSKVLMHSTFIENSKERLEERLAILNFIKQKDLGNKTVLAEIKNIENILVIQQGLIDLDESKIYVNEQGIIENELNDYKAIYERFKVISDISNKQLFILNGKLTAFKSQENTELEKIEYSNNPVYDLYLELFNAVKDKFLNSQFGIVAYLSTRIRHGVLVGELRPIFENYKLITLKEGNSGIYRRNIYWDIVYNDYSNEDREQIQITLRDFASKVDGIIFDLIKKQLQVFKPEINDDGWFNYEFDETDLWFHSIKSIYYKDFTQFVEGIFEVLWERTDDNLEIIRYKIQNNILEEFNKIFLSLEKQVISQLGPNGAEPILKGIKACSTETQTVIQKISRWFKRSQIKASDFNISELISVIIEYTNKSSWHKKLIVQKELEYDCKIKGEFKTHFADLVRIFLENILKHSDIKTRDLNCKIKTSVENERFLQIVISNEIENEGLLESLKTIWTNKYSDKSKLLEEGKSGYHKAYKILTSDLKCNYLNCLKTNVSEEDKTFSVNLLINVKDLVV